MDKQQIAKEILNKYKIQGYVPKNKQSVDLDSRFAEIDAIASGQVSETGEPKRTFGQKVGDVGTKIASFTGGEELGQGIGQGIALGKNVKQIEQIQQQQFDTQKGLIDAIKKGKQSGQDTTKLELALSDITNQITKTGDTAEQIYNPNQLTNKQIIGDALQLGTTLASIGSLKGAAAGKLPGTTSVLKTATQTPGIIQGAIQGAKTGALSGTAFGASTGVSQGLQEDKNAVDILKQGATGALTGGVTGGIIGGLLGGVSGGIKQSKINKQNAYLKEITPDTKDLTPTEYEELLNKGKISPKTSTKPAQYILSEGEKNIAKKYKDIFTNDPVKNTERIIDEISKKDKEVGVFLEKNNGIFSSGELKNNLSKKLDGIDDLLVSDEKLNKAKISVVDNFIKGLKKNDMKSLWQARKEFDRQIEKAFTGSPTLQNSIKKEFRNAVQDFISERTPEGVYKTAMKDMTELFNLKDVVSTKAIKEKGLNAIQIWIKRNPTKAKAIGWTAGTGIIGTVGSSILKD